MAIFNNKMFHLTVVNKGFGWTTQPFLSDLFHEACYQHVLKIICSDILSLSLLAQ